MKPDPDHRRAVFNRLERMIDDLDIEDAVFILIHLFGPTVQWNVSAESRSVGFLQPTTWTDDQLRAAMDYERLFRSFWQDGTPLVLPLAIPEFQPTRWLSRYQGTVV